MVQNHLETIPWTNYLGSTLQTRYLRPIPWVKIPWSKYHGPKPKSSTCTRLSLHESLCICIHAFWSANPHVYAALSRGTYVYLIFFILWAWTVICHLSKLPSKTTPVSYCQQSPPLDLMAKLTCHTKNCNLNELSLFNTMSELIPLSCPAFHVFCHFWSLFCRFI